MIFIYGLLNNLSLIHISEPTRHLRIAFSGSPPPPPPCHAVDGKRDPEMSRGLGDVYKRQA
ncbi:hypothetical protein ACX3V1_22945 [Escherichia coli]